MLLLGNHPAILSFCIKVDFLLHMKLQQWFHYVELFGGTTFALATLQDVHNIFMQLDNNNTGRLCNIQNTTTYPNMWELLNLF